MATLGRCVPIAPSSASDLVRLALEEEVDLVVIGPEAPLADGLADGMLQAGVRVFGPTAAAARIESSKSYARDLMTRAGVPQPEYAVFHSAPLALDYINERASRGIPGAVVKASGLAAGKGAVVCDTPADSARAVESMLTHGSFGEAGREILIEERLQGEEVSLLVLTDGLTALPLPAAQDHKRIGEGDTGPNTGGMGAYAPAPVLTPELLESALQTIVHPVLQGLAADGSPFRGCLYAGLMLTDAGLRVIEFNCRFGDPEAQAILPLLDTDFLELLAQAAGGNLSGLTPRIRPGAAMSVVLASAGYPGDYTVGKSITGVEAAEAVPGVAVFHAGTKAGPGGLLTAGGRVLAVSATGLTFADAAERAYRAADLIQFEGATMRRDIGHRVR